MVNQYPIEIWSSLQILLRCSKTYRITSRVINKLSKGFYNFVLIFGSLNLFLNFSLIKSREDFRFDAIEAQNPYECSLEEWKQFLRDVPPLKWVLINSRPLWDKYNDVMPTKEQLEDCLKETANYVKQLNVSKVHLLMKDITNESQMYCNYNLNSNRNYI